MRIIVTGASGFLGNHVCRTLQVAGRDVIGVSRRAVAGFPVRQVADYRATPDGDVLVHLADTADRAAARAAGAAHVSRSVATLEILLKRGYRTVVYASSGAVYGDASIAARRVGDPTPADDPYAQGKLAGEALVAAAGGVSLRMANLYGPGMSTGNVLSVILSQVPGAGPLRVRDTAPERDFLWIEDAAEAIAAAVTYRGSRVFNVASGGLISIRELASLALEIVGEAARPIESTRQTGERSRLDLDIDDTIKELGWSPRTSLRTGLSRLLAEPRRKEIT